LDPDLRSLRPLVRPPTARVEVVRDLFVLGTRVWNEELVHKSFMSLEAEEIMKIKSGVNLSHDVLAWAFEKHGFLFSVLRL
jgi:hypothetical protein